MNIKEAVYSKIETANEEIAKRAIDALAEQTIGKRVDLIVSASTELDNFEKELRKLRPDVKTYDAEGKSLEVFSNERFEQRKKVQEKLEKIRKHLDAALADPSKFGDLASALGHAK